DYPGHGIIAIALGGSKARAPRQRKWTFHQLAFQRKLNPVLKLIGCRNRPESHKGARRSVPKFRPRGKCKPNHGNDKFRFETRNRVLRDETGIHRAFQAVFTGCRAASASLINILKGAVKTHLRVTLLRLTLVERGNYPNEILRFVNS